MHIVALPCTMYIVHSTMYSYIVYIPVQVTDKSRVAGAFENHSIEGRTISYRCSRVPPHLYFGSSLHHVF